MRARWLMAAALVASAPLVGVETAFADDRGPERRTGAYINDSDEPTAEAVAELANHEGRGGRRGGRRPRSTSTAPPNPCPIRDWIEDAVLPTLYLSDGTPIHSPTGRWRVVQCNDAGGGVDGLVVAPVTPSVDPAALAARARNSVSIPDPLIATSPAADRSLYVRVPTWLWLEGDWWRSYSASASAAGVRATVTARPVRAVWSTGDGNTVTCNGPGVPWAPGAPEDATDCQHTYTTSSDRQPGGIYSLSVTVEFDVAWSSNVGASGSLDGISRESSRAVRVREIQAIETR